MDTIAGGALIILGLIAFNNYKNQTLGHWLRAKFFNQDPLGVGAKPASTSGGASITAIPAASSGLGGGAGLMIAPVSGPISSPFGQRQRNFHTGIDFAVPDGTAVHAARAGKVISAGGAGAYGLKVDLDHGEGIRTRYAHLSRIDVHLGDTVAGGATLGLSGHTGDATGPHVHFEVIKNGTAVDPAPYLTGGLPAGLATQTPVVA